MAVVTLVILLLLCEFVYFLSAPPPPDSLLTHLRLCPLVSFPVVGLGPDAAGRAALCLPGPRDPGQHACLCRPGHACDWGAGRDGAGLAAHRRRAPLVARRPFRRHHRWVCGVVCLFVCLFGVGGARVVVVVPVSGRNGVKGLRKPAASRAPALQPSQPVPNFGQTSTTWMACFRPLVPTAPCGGGTLARRRPPTPWPSRRCFDPPAARWSVFV